MDDTLSRRESAEYAGVHYNTIRLWERSGKIHPTRVIVHGVPEVRISIAELEQVRGDRPETQKRPRPPALEKNPEAMRVWSALEKLEDEAQKLRSKTARLEAENAHLLERLEAAETERERLLSTVLKMAGGTR